MLGLWNSLASKRVQKNILESGQSTEQNWIEIKYKSISLSNYSRTGQLQLDEYETAPYFVQLSTSDCLLISVYLPVLLVFAWCDHKIVLQIKLKHFYEHNMQKLAKTSKYTKINKQSHVKFWLDWRKYRTVSYSFSCTVK